MLSSFYFLKYLYTEYIFKNRNIYNIAKNGIK